MVLDLEQPKQALIQNLQGWALKDVRAVLQQQLLETVADGLWEALRTQTGMMESLDRNQLGDAVS